MLDWLFANKDKINHDKQLLLDAWKESVNVQMHFNDMEMKIRTLAVTVVSAIGGAIGYLLKEDLISTPFTVMLFFIGFAAWTCFYFMDRFMYHKLLKGAVTSGIKIEEELKEVYGIDVALGQCIKDNSPVNIFCNDALQMHSDQKLDFFYTSVPLICVNGFLIYLNYSSIATIIFLILDIIFALYTLAKGYTKNDYNWTYYATFLILNILFIIFLYLVYKCDFLCFILLK